MLRILLAMGVAMVSLVSPAHCGPSEPLIHDLGLGTRPQGHSLEQITDPNFHAFVARTTEQVAQLDGSIELEFYRLPIASSGDTPVSLPEMSTPNGEEVCALRSPWIAAQINKNDGQKDHAQIYWNERQILTDVARLAGKGLEAAPRQSLAQSDFQKFGNTYTSAVTQMQELPIGADALPEDIEFLFRRAPQASRGPFFATALGYMNKERKWLSEYYADLVVLLLNECVALGGGELLYHDVQDVPGVLPATNLVNF